MKALSAGGVYTGEPWLWIQNVLRDQAQHLSALAQTAEMAAAPAVVAAAQAWVRRRCCWI
jgi:cytochrome c-type biogenesis protein CcmH